MKTAAFVTVALLMTALPASAQADRFALRPYGMVTYQAFSAKTTFDAAFGESSYPFWGAGAELILPKHIYVDVSASRFKKTGQRAFLNNGQAFPLGIPLTATITPFEIAGGYRVVLTRHPGITPFAGAGVGWYSYKETSAFAATGEDVDTTHVGGLVVGGVEFRVHRWIALSGDVQYTHVPGILGTGGISKDAGENDLGGVAARFKFIVGR
jgi:Outer membrane protein beta-barrel domain